MNYLILVVSKEAKMAITRAASVFVLFLTSGMNYKQMIQTNYQLY